MPRERKYNFVPITNEDLRKRKESFEKKYDPYVRIQKPGLLVFPRKTLEHLEIDTKAGTLVCLKWWVDPPTRTIAFKIMKSVSDAGLKDIKTMKVVNYKNTGSMGTVSINPILRSLGGEWLQPCICPISEYNDTDSLLGIGEVHTFFVPKAKKVEIS